MGRSGNGRKDRDEDLLLFRELHRREKERIATLLQPVSDEFEPNSGGLVPPTANALFRIAKGYAAGYDLFTDKDKTDYDWLKTPPATPLFPSLEMEANYAPEVVVQRDLPIHPLSRFAAIRNKALRPKSRYSRPGLPSSSAAPTTNRPDNENASSTKPNTNTTAPKASDQIHKNNFLSSNTGFTTKTYASNTKQQPESRGIRPTVLPPQEFRGFSDQAPPNLRTVRPASATRARAASNPKKPELTTPKLMPGRQSCSPGVARDHEPNKSNKNKSNATGTGTQVLGSRMVDKLMSARKSNANPDDHKVPITTSRPKSSGSEYKSNVFNQVEMKRERNYNPPNLGVLSNW